MPDFIPSSDDDFNTFASNLNGSVSGLGNPLKLAADQITAFTAAYGEWTPAWKAWEAMAPGVQAALMAKDTSRAALTAAARAINGAVQANPAVSAEAKAAADLPVHKQTRTPVGEIETAPMMSRVDNEHLLQRLWFVDSATPNIKARPAGAAFCEIRHQVVAAGGPAPTDPEAMPFLATDTRAPYRSDLEAADVGKASYYALRWVNTRGQAGPWSAITGYLIN
jgi:hypothetical protein